MKKQTCPRDATTIVKVEGKTVRLTNDQRKALRRVGRAMPDVGFPLLRTRLKQLEKKGLVQQFGSHTRYEWNEPVATMPVAHLTEFGRKVFEALPPVEEC